MAAIEGDIVVVLIGCDYPMILRPTKEGNYKFVGQAYYDGFMNGEALLGPVPDSFSTVLRYSPPHGGYQSAYIDQKTGSIQVEDPRLGPLPHGWKVKSHSDEEFLQLFVNDDTGLVAVDDPRITSEG